MTRQINSNAILATSVFLLAWGLFCFLSVRENTIGLLSDSYIYLLLADFFSPLHSLDKDFAAYLFSSYAYPPGFPILLGLLGGGSETTALNYVIDAAFLAGAIAAYFVWLLTQGLTRIQAGTLACVFMLLPGTLLSSLGILSEHPYLLVTLVCASLMRSPFNSKNLLIAALLIGCVALIRTVGVAAIFAFTIVCVLHYASKLISRRTCVLSLAFAISPFALWSAFRKFFDFESSYSDSIVSGDYLESFIGIVHQLPINLQAFWQHFKPLLTSFDSLGSVACAMIISLMLIGWILALRKLRFDALYVLIYLCIIFAWPYPDHYGRFIFVILPLLLFYAFDGFRILLSLLMPKTRSETMNLVAGASYLLILVILSTLGSLEIIKDIYHQHGTALHHIARTPDWHLLPSHNRAEKITALEKMLGSLQKVDQLTPSTACVSSGEPHFVHFYARRRSSRPLPESADENSFERSLHHCPFVFMMAVASIPPSEFPAMYPFHRIEQEMLVLDVSFFEGDTKQGTVSTMLAATGVAKKTIGR